MQQSSDTPAASASGVAGALDTKSIYRSLRQVERLTARLGSGGDEDPAPAGKRPKSVTSVLASHDFGFLSATNPAFRQAAQAANDQATGLLSSLVSLQADLLSRLADAGAVGTSARDLVDRCQAGTFTDMDDVRDGFAVVGDVTDSLLEWGHTVMEALNVEGGLAPDTPLTGAAGAIARGKQAAAGGDAVVSSFRVGNSLDYRLIHGQNISPPQQTFPDKVDNSQATFVPSLLAKPHSLAPFDRAEYLASGVSKNSQLFDCRDMIKEHYEKLGIDSSLFSFLLPQETIEYPHPYAAEIEALRATLPTLPMAPVTEQMYLPMESTPRTWVDTPELLEDMRQKLLQVREIAVDLEHHSYRSFRGFVCLMQISTRTEDFLVDTLALRGHLQAALGDIFADPSVVKVLHGADSDIVWLERDFGLYIVNLFDTGQAARVLQLPHFSLAHLLSSVVGVSADKRYQLADWRIRPLPREMAHYAQMDTHYLLFIWDRLRNQLLARSGSGTGQLLLTAMARSLDVSLKRHATEAFDPVLAFMQVAARTQRRTAPGGAHSADGLSTKQRAVARALCIWREGIARQEDESVPYILPNSHLLRLVATLPANDRQGVISCSHSCSPAVRANADVLAALIHTAMESAPETANFHLPFSSELPSAPSDESSSSLMSQFTATADLRPYEAKRKVSLFGPTRESTLLGPNHRPMATPVLPPTADAQAALARAHHSMENSLLAPGALVHTPDARRPTSPVPPHA
ncbi:hypothetical protein, variant [Fonticula alba]|uniref:HRDC domain-containing protein n=1 Tax=Fonticula alba TaxID=691883 RepID=A0A058Z9B4_FONAL|nr:hypothetical protein, variant [Fonticula alba]KCV70904.1 hypothetical protein, variant [Fonticula alba]|eukprot:XP_009494026.1 hypothetical protein, variant [Fonticula alba]